MTYSHKRTVAAITDFYHFLVDMWMPPEAINYPPDGGWPELREELLAKFGKSATVARLAKHIPYIRGEGPSSGSVLNRFENLDILPGSYALDYRNMMPEHWVEDNWHSWNDAHGCCRGDFGPGIVPLVHGGGEHNWNLLLDTENDVVVISDSDGLGFRNSSNEHQIRRPCDDSQELEESQEWRRWQTYSTLDFFEELKNHYRTLHWIPKPYEDGEGTMVEWDRGEGYWDDEEQRLKNIFLRNGWPTENYNKEKCLQELFNLKGQIDFESDRLSH